MSLLHGPTERPKVRSHCRWEEAQPTFGFSRETPKAVNKSIYRPGGKTTPSREPVSPLFGR